MESSECQTSLKNITTIIFKPPNWYGFSRDRYPAQFLIKTNFMNYSFFLFSKLYDIHNPNEHPYDILFDELCTLYKYWQKWDEISGKDLGEYESMEKYFKWGKHRYQVANYWVLGYGSDCDGFNTGHIRSFANEHDAECCAEDQNEWSDGIRFVVVDNVETMKAYCNDYNKKWENYINL